MGGSAVLALLISIVASLNSVASGESAGFKIETVTPGDGKTFPTKGMFARLQYEGTVRASLLLLGRFPIRNSCVDSFQMGPSSTAPENEGFP